MEPQPTSLYPPYLTTFSIPNDPVLKGTYKTYKPSIQTLRLLSEQGRTIYPEVFIENSHLDTLKNLCTSVLARFYGASPSPLVAEDPLLLQVHYDSLDVDLPLAECYAIKEERFWKRVVLAKHKDKSLAIKPNVDWKNVGISLKFVELVEQCPVEYWPEEDMTKLALKVKEFVKEMNIKHLQPLKDRSFEKYFEAESEDVSSEEDISSTTEDSELSSSVEEDLDAEGVKEKEQRKKERQELREAKQKAREAKEAKRKKLEAKKAAREKREEKPLGQKIINNNLFDIKFSDSEDDGEDRIVDKRNKPLLLEHIKKYNYPPNDCHHIDLKFVQYFTNLETFTIEFLGPLENDKFQKRHINFSYQDIQNLSLGLSYLSQLKIFRLRNSAMDAEKFQTLCAALGLLPCLETIDFGFDQLREDCALAFEQLFAFTKSLKNLELESNFFNEQVLQHIGQALKSYTANEISYLGLARNPITDHALHGLVSAIIGTKHVKYLNIRAIKFLTDTGLCCCVADELLSKHPILVKLDICAVPISALAADEIIKSLAKNENILEICCSGCELDEETEIDINIIMERNKFISENYFLGNPSITTEEITKWLNRSRNPIYLKVLAERESHKQCLQKRSEESTLSSHLYSPAISHHSSLDMTSQIYRGRYSTLETPAADQATSRFVYPANDFDEQQFLENVYQPGPQERYNYFKMFKQKYSIRDNEKNLNV